MRRLHPSGARGSPPQQRSLGALDATVERNAYGRQIDSTILTLPTELPGGPLEMVFIRSPRITRVGDGVEVLARRDGFPILVRQGHLLAATFHPEMTADTRVQQFFLEMVRAHKTLNDAPRAKRVARPRGLSWSLCLSVSGVRVCQPFMPGVFGSFALTLRELSPSGDRADGNTHFPQ